MTSAVLDRILAAKRGEVEGLEIPPGARGVPVLPFAERMRRGRGEPLRLIAEVKRRSPSAGPLSTALSPAARALAYVRAGASAVSVLCDAAFFDGSWDHVAAVRDAFEAAGARVPILAKEFVLDERQVVMAERVGADAVLLIVRVLGAQRTRALVDEARARGIEPLVEVATEAELAVALDSGATVVGVNARDLDTLVMDAERARRVVAQVPARCVALYLSGLRSDGDIDDLALLPIDGALVGETLMRVDDPTAPLEAMVAAARRHPR